MTPRLDDSSPVAQAEAPAWIWIDEKTGEDLGQAEERPRETAVRLWIDELPVFSSRILEDEDRLIAAFVEDILGLRHLREAIQAQLAARVREYNARIAYLERTVGASVDRIVRDRVGTRKRDRYIETDAARLQLRRGRPKTEVIDEDTALEAVAELCPEALKKTVRILVSKIPEGLELPGIKRTEGEDRLRIEEKKKKPKP